MQVHKRYIIKGLGISGRCSGFVLYVYLLKNPIRLPCQHDCVLYKLKNQDLVVTGFG